MVQFLVEVEVAATAISIPHWFQHLWDWVAKTQFPLADLAAIESILVDVVPFIASCFVTEHQHEKFLKAACRMEHIMVDFNRSKRLFG